VTPTRLLTIGGYGFTPTSFIAALKTAGVDTFVDIRQRRGMRGHQYAFLNKARLQASLESGGIRYVYVPELAPTSEIRDQQKARDAQMGVSKRARKELAPEFIRAFQDAVLRNYTKEQFLRAIRDSRTCVLFCVEGAPEACHRSLVAAHLSEILAVSVEHLRP
jgi:uncharacterized protein (DUF488 family)